jgi:hypothetical protein
VFTIACEPRCDESAGFPSEFRPTTRKVIASVAAGELHAPSSAFSVNVDHEVLRIPYRLYYSPRLLRWNLSTSYGVKKLILACLGTRHYDGYLRQQCLGYLLSSMAAWTIPYIVQLAGEYVVEIVDEVAAGITSCETSSLAAFTKQNPDYVAMLERRVTSYWNEYHRRAYPRRSDYPGSKVIAYLQNSLELPPWVVDFSGWQLLSSCIRWS